MGLSTISGNILSKLLKSYTESGFLFLQYVCPQSCLQGSVQVRRDDAFSKSIQTSIWPYVLHSLYTSILLLSPHLEQADFSCTLGNSLAGPNIS